MVRRTIHISLVAGLLLLECLLSRTDGSHQKSSRSHGSKQFYLDGLKKLIQLEAHNQQLLEDGIVTPESTKNNMLAVLDDAIGDLDEAKLKRAERVDKTKLKPQAELRVQKIFSFLTETLQNTKLHVKKMSSSGILPYKKRGATRHLARILMDILQEEGDKLTGDDAPKDRSRSIGERNKSGNRKNRNKRMTLGARGVLQLPVDKSGLSIVRNVQIRSRNIPIATGYDT